MSAATKATYEPHTITAKLNTGETVYFISSSDGHCYYKVEHAAGHLTCSCPARKPCKHIAYIAAKLTTALKEERESAQIPDDAKWSLLEQVMPERAAELHQNAQAAISLMEDMIAQLKATEVSADLWSDDAAPAAAQEDVAQQPAETWQAPKRRNRSKEIQCAMCGCWMRSLDANNRCASCAQSVRARDAEQQRLNTEISMSEGSDYTRLCAERDNAKQQPARHIHTYCVECGRYMLYLPPTQIGEQHHCYTCQKLVSMEDEQQHLARVKRTEQQRQERIKALETALMADTSTFSGSIFKCAR